MTLTGFRDATAEVPAHARERVWRRLQEPKRPGATWWPWLAGAAVAAGLALFALMLRPAPAIPLVAMPGDGFVAVARAGALTVHSEQLELGSGEVLVSSWGGRVEVVSGSHHVSTDAAVFSLRAAADGVVLTVAEGAVSYDGERVVAGRADGVDFAPLRAAEPSEAAVERSWALAENAAAEGRTEEAVERFAALARSSSLRAEAALLRKAQLELWSLHQPGDALSTLASATGRFPHGALQQEIAFSELEALVARAQWEAAATRARAFEARFPRSERRAEVALVEAIAAANLGTMPEACRLLRGIDSSQLGAEQARTAAELSKRCTFFER